jgi:signal transduction histidine kinase
MTGNFSALIQILTQSPGDLIYHLVVTLPCLIAGIIALFNLKHTEKAAAAKRVLIVCCLIILIQILIFTLGRIFLQEAFNASPPMAMLERTAYSILIIWVIWVFFENDTHFLITGTSIFLTLGLIFFGAGLILLHNLNFTIMPEISQIHLGIWQISTLFLIIVGLVLLIQRKPKQYGIGVAILFIIGVGYLIQVLTFEPNLLGMGAVRLAFTLSLPWLLMLTQRFVSPEADFLGNRRIKSHLENQEIDKTKPALIHDLLRIGLLENIQERQKAIIQALCLGTLADICFLVEIKDNGNQVTFQTGYDLIRQVFYEPVHLSREELQQIMNAWEANEILQRSQRDISNRDSSTLTKILRIGRHGNILAYPLNIPDRSPAGGLIFLAPYTERSFIDARNLMDTIKDTLAKVLFEPMDLDTLSAELENLKAKNQLFYEEKEQLTRALHDKETQIKHLNNELKQWKAKFQIERLDTVQRVDHMKDEITKLKIQVSDQAGYPAQLEQYQTEIRQLIAERDQLEAALAQANTKISKLETQSGQTGPIRLSLDVQVINLDAVATNARLKLEADLQQKQIDLAIENPEASAMLKTDPDLLHLVVYNLLDNAVKVSKPGAQVKWSQKLSYETGMLIIQVTDFGPGLDPQEQNALFSADPPAIPGIGSLEAIREAIRAIRVLNGKIWLRSKRDTFTTFRVQLPVRIID